MMTSHGTGLMPEYIFGALHGSFHAARIIAAINTPGTHAVLTWQTFMQPVNDTRFPNDWCGQSAGNIMSPGFPNRPDLALVTGQAQLVAHMFSRALAMATMHPVAFPGGPTMQFPIFDDAQPCLQAAAFLSGNSSTSTASNASNGGVRNDDATAGSSSSGNAGLQGVIAVLNICNTTIPFTVDLNIRVHRSAADADGLGAPLQPATGSTALPSRAAVVQVAAVEYSLLDKGGKGPLPLNPKEFPWPKPLSGIKHRVAAGDVYTAQPFSFAVLEAQ